MTKEQVVRRERCYDHDKERWFCIHHALVRKYVCGVKCLHIVLFCKLCC